MNQVEIGKFIASCRKEKGFTQVQLAEKLNITDRAVSKWETGKSMPDSSIMLELCDLLGITVNELLSGERIEMDHYEEKVNQNLIELKKKDENNRSRNAMISVVYTVTIVVGILVCCLCDFAVTGKLTWSLITLSSILITWAASFPAILLGRKGIIVSMISISILIIPFLYVLSIILKVAGIFRIGVVMSVISLIFLWLTFLLYQRLRERKLLATGITFLFAIPITFLINFALAQLIDEPIFDIWDLLTVFILLILAVVFIRIDVVKRKSKMHGAE